MVEALPAAVYTTDAEGRLTHFNSAAVALSGQTPDLANDRWCVSWKLFWPDGTPLPHDQCPMALALRERRALRGAEIVIERPDGTRAWAIASPTPLFDSQGQLVGGINMLVDISERERAETALRESEERYRSLLSAITSVVWTTDPAGRFVAPQPSWSAFTGQTWDELRDFGWTAALHPDDRQRVLEQWRAACAAQTSYRSEGRLWHAVTQMYRHFEARGVPIRGEDGSVREWVGKCLDVEDRKRAEAALQVQNERLRLLWEAAGVLLSTDDPNAMLHGLLAKIGPHLGLDAYFNFLVDETGQCLRMASCAGIPDETARSIDRLEFGQAICGTVALRRQTIVATHIQRSDDPKVQLVKSLGFRAYACSPLLSENLLLGTLSFASRSRDSFEPDEQAFLSTISHYVAVAYERLRLLGKLQETDRRKDEFLATLAHELRGPLAPLASALEILKRAQLDADGDGEPLSHARATMDRQLGQMVRLVDDLLDVSRISQGRLELRRERVELTDVVDQAVEACQALADHLGHQLNVSLPSEPVILDADPVRLAQVLGNLLHNACKYTEPGGRIDLSAERQGSDVAISVTDTGIGIPAEALPKVFEMFAQVDGALERSQGGLGIGLTLVRRLVEMHGGTVEVQSEGRNRGSQFTVRLPMLIEEPRPPRPARSGGQEQRLTGRRILIVDDNVDSAASLAMLLRITGNETHTAHDGLEAVASAQRLRPDAVLLDIGLPKLNGYEACRRIREQPWSAGMVLVALTGWGQDEDRRKSLDAGFDHHLVKPVDYAALSRLLGQPKGAISPSARAEQAEPG
jgi:PAS domain S-box-containing protein